jgi:hypothetical protein
MYTRVLPHNVHSPGCFREALIEEMKGCDTMPLAKPLGLAIESFREPFLSPGVKGDKTSHVEKSTGREEKHGNTYLSVTRPRSSEYR